MLTIQQTKNSTAMLLYHIIYSVTSFIRNEQKTDKEYRDDHIFIVLYSASFDL